MANSCSIRGVKHAVNVASYSYRSTPPSVLFLSLATVRSRDTSVTLQFRLWRRVLYRNAEVPLLRELAVGEAVLQRELGPKSVSILMETPRTQQVNLSVGKPRLHTLF